MVLYQFDFTVVAFPFGFRFLSLELFWIDVIDLIDSTEKKSRKVLHTGNLLFGVFIKRGRWMKNQPTNRFRVQTV